MITRLIRIASFGLVTILVTLTSSFSQATLIDNGGSTVDTGSGLEWLDLTATMGQTYNSIIGGFGGYSAAGYVYATTSQLCGLWSNAGAGTANCLSSTSSVTESISQVSADLLTGLFGDTFTNSSVSISSGGIFDSGQIGSGLLGLGCINAGPSTLCIPSSTPPPTAERLLTWATFTGRNDMVGSWLVRPAVQTAPASVPATLPLLGLGLAALGFSRRKRNLQS